LEVQMSRVPGGVLTRVITFFAAALAAVLAVVSLGSAPAGALARADDLLAEASQQTLLDLQDAQAKQSPAAGVAVSAEESAAAQARYQSDLSAVAAFVAPRTESMPEDFLQAWTAAGPTRMTVVLSALAQVGVPYRSRASAPGQGFDCSGLTMYAWFQAGVALPHNDHAQLGVATARAWDTALAGDLVQYPGHVMIFLGAGHSIVHAPNSRSLVRVQDLGGQWVRLGSPLS
jgi:cell wall-associated NlpC family hydrolase